MNTPAAVPATAAHPRALHTLETPCLIADRQRIARNAARMRERAEALGLTLRPHLKTLKAAAAARLAHGGATGPITVSTLREAEYFLARGFVDLTYAVCLVPNKFAHVAALVARGARLQVLVASETMAAALADAFTDAGQPLAVMLEIDCGDGRTGLAPDDAALVAAARTIEAAGGLRFAGLLTHGGHSYGARTRQEIVAAAEDERSALLEGRDRLREAGIRTPLLSSGSTPTAMLGENFDGLDELRPGVYLAGDLFQVQLGTCTLDDIAVSVLATVIDVDRARGQVVIDAGGLALSKDRSTAESPVDYGYGLVVRADGTRLPADPVVGGVSQEHGRVTCAGANGMPWSELTLGAMVRVLPNHACMTAASHGRYWVVEGGEQVVDEWDKATGW